MTAFEVYKMNLAVQRHFAGAYDYFKYNGSIKVSVESFENHKQQHLLLKISRMNNPEHFIIGNALYNPSKWLGDYTKEFADTYTKYMTTGMYLFTKELPLLLTSFVDNFVTTATKPVPYIIQLYNQQKISLHTASVFQEILNCKQKWSQKTQYMIFEEPANKIAKAAPFFNIDKPKYQAIIVKHFNV